MMPTAATLAVTSCTTNRGNAALGLVIIALFVGAIVLFAVLHAQARSRLAIAHSELALLRPEVARLRGMSGAGGSSPATWPTGPGWYADPMQRHQYRMWSGYSWSDDVADGGNVSRDPMTGGRT
jgi:hypothetical protein